MATSPPAALQKKTLEIFSSCMQCWGLIWPRENFVLQLPHAVAPPWSVLWRRCCACVLACNGARDCTRRRRL